MIRPFRIFVPSAAALLTDRHGHGEGLAAHRLLAELAARGHELVVLAREADLGEPPAFEIVETGSTSRLESLEPLAYARRAQRELGRRGRFDVIHWLFPNTAGEVLFAPPSGTPYVIGPHTAPWPRRSRRPRRAGDAVRLAASPLLGSLEQRARNRASALLYETDGGLRALAGRHATKAHVVSGGVDAERFVATEPPQRNRILFVGRLDRAKGVRELVEAFARVHAATPDAELVLAGEGAERGWIEERARSLRLNGAVTLLGAVPSDDLPGLLAGASVFCLPSDGEPYGYSALEAMAAGRAVVTTDNGGPAEYVDGIRGGRVVAREPGAIAEALTDVLSDRTRLIAMGAFNRARVENDLSTARMVDRLEEIYTRATREAP